MGGMDSPPGQAQFWKWVYSSRSYMSKIIEIIIVFFDSLMLSNLARFEIFTHEASVLTRGASLYSGWVPSNEPFCPPFVRRFVRPHEIREPLNRFW